MIDSAESKFILNFSELNKQQPVQGDNMRLHTVQRPVLLLSCIHMPVSAVTGAGAHIHMLDIK